MKKKQALFSLKDKSKKLKCRLLQIMFGALRVNTESALGVMRPLYYFSSLKKTQC